LTRVNQGIKQLLTRVSDQENRGTLWVAKRTDAAETIVDFDSATPLKTSLTP